MQPHEVEWVTEEAFTLRGVGDVLTFFGSIAGTILLLVGLLRILSPREPSEEAVAAYRSILRFFATGVAISLACILASVFP